MFYPIESLRRGGRFYLCWVADSWPLRFATLTQRQLSSQDIRDICDDLAEVIKNESGRAINRFSLRLSSQLLRGLVRLYHRKVTMFVCDVCMVNAKVMKIIQRKLCLETVGQVVPRRTFRELPRITIEEVDEETVEEQLQNANNLVARFQDITLREPTLPENRPLIDDGFGELHQDQPLQILMDRSVEMMMVQETSALQQSVVDLPLDSSADKSHDKSRLAPHDVAFMERISEHEISVFRKSSAAASTLLDFEKEIPDVSEILPPELSVPHLPKQIDDKTLEIQIEEAPTDQAALEKTLDIILEELEEVPQRRRAKLRNKLLIDKKIKLSSDYLRSRIGNNNLEMRCENKKQEKVINIRVAANMLLSRAAHCGFKPNTNLGATLSNLFTWKLDSSDKAPADGDVEQALRQRSTQPEEIDRSIDKTIQGEQLQGLQDAFRQLDVNEANILEGQASTAAAHAQEAIDMADLPTQLVANTSAAEKRTSELEGEPKRRRCDEVFRQRKPSLDTSVQDANKENIPGTENVPEERAGVVVAERTDVPRQTSKADRLTLLLEEAGLADVPTEVQRTPLTERRNHSSENSETPLGSLDRTNVSLGDHEVTPDWKIFIQEEWGTQGTMLKIFHCCRANLYPITVATLLENGPIVPGHKRLIAARCFSSILKLIQHGFITIEKETNTNEIKHIKLGAKTTEP